EAVPLLPRPAPGEGGPGALDAAPDPSAPLRLRPPTQPRPDAAGAALADVVTRHPQPDHLVHGPPPSLGDRKPRRGVVGVLLHRRLLRAARRQRGGGPGDG